MHPPKLVPCIKTQNTIDGLTYNNHTGRKMSYACSQSQREGNTSDQKGPSGGHL